MDADSDGHHICTLLLTFFYRHMRELIDEGHVFIAQPPLYRIEVGKEMHWALDDAERDRILADSQRQASQRAALQRPRRDEPGDAEGDHARSRAAAPCCGSRSPTTATTEQTIQTLMGKDVEPRFNLHHGARAEGRGPRRLTKISPRRRGENRLTFAAPDLRNSK